MRTNYREKADFCNTVPATDRVPRTDLEAYSNNLRSLIGMARANDVQILFMTQQSTWNSSVDPEAEEWHWMRYNHGLIYREDLMEQALEAYNDVMRRLARVHGVPLFDVSKRFPKSLEFFYDDVHFNVRGARTAGTELALLVLNGTFWR